MAVKYVDANRGSDSNSGDSVAQAYRTLAMINNFLPGAGGGVYLAADSIWEVNPTTAASNGSAQTRFNGSAGNPAFIAPYYPAGNVSTKPTIRYRMIPVAADWTWDATDNLGEPKGWYIQLNWLVNSWDAWVKVNGAFIGTMNQDTTNNTGLGYINGTQNGPNAGNYVNGMTRDTFRFNLDFGGANVAGNTNTRLYLSGLGLHTSGAGNDPTSVLGPGSIQIGWRPFFSFYNSLSHVLIDGIRCEYGSGLLLMQADADQIIPGLEVRNCESYDTSHLLRINCGTGDVATSKWTIDVHDNTMDLLSGPALMAYGVGVAGYLRNNTFTRGNRSSSMGGGAYIQCKPSTYGGVRDPFVVSGNVADDWVNGAGNNGFDGGCYYIDVQDEGSIIRGNIAKNSYVAYQCGSGSRCEWFGNISLNCEKMGMFNNALSVQAQDYTIANNLHIGAARGTFSHGQDADTHQYALTVYQSGTASNLVSGKIINNVLINAASDPTRIAIDAYDATQWASGKLHIANNLCIGFNARQVVSDFNVTDRTSQASPLTATLDQCGFQNYTGLDFRIGTDSALWRAGVDSHRGGAVDPAGRTYYSPPSVGPYEVPRPADYFWRPHT